jgi:NADH:ubiquinone reductase (H+-translocating)
MNAPTNTDVLVAGGGFAAVWTAAAAARRRAETGAHLSITLVAPSDDMVMRPRLYEARPGAMRIPLRRILEPIGVAHMRAHIDEIDVGARRVVAVCREGARLRTTFGRLVIATGSRLVRSDRLPGAAHLHDVDTLPGAVALDEHLHSLPSRRVDEGRYTAVVVGAGFVGLELATELVTRLQLIAAPHGAMHEVRVVLVERAPVVGPELGAGPRPVIESALEELGVELRLGLTVTALDDRLVRLSDGTTIPALTAVWTAGMQASPLTQWVPGPHDSLGRLEVDRHLRVIGVDPVFAAGDTASIEVAPGQRALQACQYAHQLGKHAGYNAVGDLLALPLVDFDPEPYVTCLDLGAAGAVYTEGFERAVRASGATGKDIKRSINGELISPPLDDATEILRRADPHAARGPAADVAA